MLLWPRLVCGSTVKLTWSVSSQWVPAIGGPGGPPRFSV
jgi:hypothetical protein